MVGRRSSAAASGQTDEVDMKVWSTARAMAEATPPHRNRYIDFLRAFAIGVVVIGHWLAAAPWASTDGFRIIRMLEVATWTHQLTWALQVMPIFFFVGGYSNSASWEAAVRNGAGYAAWLHARLRRLVAPVIPLLTAWIAIGVAAGIAGMDHELIGNASRLALVPTWFLAVYMLVILMVPVAAKAWERYGLASFWLPVSLAVLVDALAFGKGYVPLRWTNYVFVWMAVHQLGFLWRSGRADDLMVAAGWILGGFAFLTFLVEVSDYPVAMLTVESEVFSNTRPPTIALVALAAMQFGIVRLLEGPVRRWLDKPGPWAGTVLVNGSIMTIFLWHSTVQVLVIAAALGLGGLGLDLQPGSLAWWAARPLWLGLMLVALFPAVALFARYERGGRAAPAHPPSAGLQAGAAVATCLGLALLAWSGVAVAGPPYVTVLPLLFALGGALVIIRAGARNSPG